MANLAGTPKMKAPAMHGGGKAPAKPMTMQQVAAAKQTVGNTTQRMPVKQANQQIKQAQHPAVHQTPTNSLMAPSPAAPKPAPIKNPYAGLIENNQQMMNQATTAANQVYQPVIDNLNQQSAQVSGLAAKRASDYQNFMTWSAGQQASMMTQAAAQDQQYNNLMGQISAGMNNNEATNAATSIQNNPNTVSNMGNSTALGALAANQGAMNNSTTGALQSAAANMANNQSQQNAWGAVNSATAANMQQQDQADYNTQMSAVDQNMAQAQSDQANAKESMLSSLQSQNATNVNNEQSYLQQQWANKNTLQQQNLAQQDKLMEDKQAAQQFNLDYKQKAQEDLTSNNQWKAEQTTAANEWTATYNQKATEDDQANAQTQINAIAAKAASTGVWTYDDVNQYNQALGVLNPGQKVTQYTPPKGQNGSSTFQQTSAGRETQSEVNEHNAQAHAATINAVTDRLKAQGALKQSLIENKIKLLAQQQDGIKTRAEAAELASEIGVHKAQMQNYIAESRKNLQEGNAAVTKANSSTSTSSTSSKANPMTPDEQTSWLKGVSDYQHSIAQALSSPANFKTVTGSAPKAGQPLQAQLRTWLGSNYGKDNPQVWVAFDNAAGTGLTPRTRQMAINHGVPNSALPPKSSAAHAARNVATGNALKDGSRAFASPLSR